MSATEVGDMVRLVEALKAAQAEATRASSEVADGGSCNMDSVCIKLKGWRQKSIDFVANETGLRIGERLGGMFSGYRFVHFATKGLAAANTVGVEAAEKSLRAAGYNVTVWYHAD